MGDRIALERLARQKVIDAHTVRENEFISRVALKSLEDIDPRLAEPFSYLSDFATDAVRLNSGVRPGYDISTYELLISVLGCRGSSVAPAAK